MYTVAKSYGLKIVQKWQLEVLDFGLRSLSKFGWISKSNAIRRNEICFQRIEAPNELDF